MFVDNIILRTPVKNFVHIKYKSLYELNNFNLPLDGVSKTDF